MSWRRRRRFDEAVTTGVRVYSRRGSASHHPPTRMYASPTWRHNHRITQSLDYQSWRRQSETRSRTVSTITSLIQSFSTWRHRLYRPLLAISRVFRGQPESDCFWPTWNNLDIIYATGSTATGIDQSASSVGWLKSEAPKRILVVDENAQGYYHIYISNK